MWLRLKFLRSSLERTLSWYTFLGYLKDIRGACISRYRSGVAPALYVQRKWSLKPPPELHFTVSVKMAERLPEWLLVKAMSKERTTPKVRTNAVLRN